MVAAEIRIARTKIINVSTAAMHTPRSKRVKRVTQLASDREFQTEAQPAVLACFDPLWPDLNRALAGFESGQF
jgi:hypothetical protein